jgi:O-antigen/teichoic acid export membrane protein
MKIKKNIFFILGTQIYIAILGIVVVPLYVGYMGAETFGLVGFFATLQVCFNLLDMGLTPTLSRETSRLHGGASNIYDYRNFVRSLEIIFYVIALVGGIFLCGASDYIAHSWLKVESLPIQEVKMSIYLMSMIVALRWLGGLYRGVISGSEKFVWLSNFSAVMATFRFLGVLLVLRYISVTPITFFSYQLIIAIVEIVCLVLEGYRILPKVASCMQLEPSLKQLRSVFKLSLAIAFTSSLWIVVTQLDKLILSKILLLSDYAYFSVAVLAASGVLMVSGPIGTALMPRLTKLEAEGDNLEFIRLYRGGTQLASIVSSAAFTTIFFYAEPLLNAWTGDKVLAQYAAPILVLYALGNAIVAVASFSYLIQYSKGIMRYHLKGNIVFALLLVPLDILAANKFGGVGTGAVWLALNLITLLFWVPFIHKKLVPGLNRKWFSEDTSFIFLTSGVLGYLLHFILPHSEDRFIEFIFIAIYGLALTLATSISSSFIRSYLKILINKFTISIFKILKI